MDVYSRDVPEGEKWPRSLEAVTRHLQLCHGVDVLYGELGRRPPRHTPDPDKQIGLSPRLEEDALVTVFHLGDLVDDKHGLLLSMHLGVRLGVGHQSP